MILSKSKLQILIPFVLSMIGGALFLPRFVHDLIYQHYVDEARIEQNRPFPSTDIQKVNYEKALQEARAWHDPLQTSKCLFALGIITFEIGELDKSLALLHEALDLYKARSASADSIANLERQIAMVTAKKEALAKPLGKS